MKRVAHVSLPITFALALTILITLPATAAMVSYVEFHQLVFEPDYEFIEPLLPSNMGECLIHYDKDPEFGYLNMMAMIPGLSMEPAWIIRNLPLASIEYGPPFEEIAKVFPLSHLGLEEGMICPDIQFGYEILISPLTDDDQPMWAATLILDQMAPVMLQEEDAFGAVVEVDEEFILADPDTSFYPPYSPVTPELEIWSWIGCEMPNIPLNYGALPTDKAGCVPASAANSLLWLEGQHDEINLDPNLRETFEQLSRLMNRQYQKGVSTKDMARAKLDFIEAHNLPIEVKVQNYYSDGDISSSSGHTKARDTDGGGLHTWPSRDWMFNESREKEDVEVIYGYWYQDATGKWRRKGGHAVVLAGAEEVLGQPRITIKHDKRQKDATGVVQQDVEIIVGPDGQMELKGKGGRWKHGTSGPVYEHRAFVDGVVSESLKNDTPMPPASESFSKYCQWFHRTLKPGQSLFLDFPSSIGYCYNVSVYRWDRTHKPPRRVKLTEWNWNRGDRKEIANNDTLAVTVSVHCDDTHYWGGSYTPWSIGLSTGASTKDTSPSNIEAFGGFSLGGSDDSCGEFNGDLTGSIMVPADLGMDLQMVPARLSNLGVGCSELFLNRQIPVWNQFWEQLGFVIDVIDLQSPGTLMVECPSTGMNIPIPITTDGRYEIDLGPMMPAPDFLVRLEPQGGLDMFIDCVSVPSIVPPSTPVDHVTDVPRQAVIASVRPNPFNPTTTISFGTAHSGPVEIDVFDIRGLHVATLLRAELAAGYHQVDWHGTTDGGRPAPAGTYLARLKSDGVFVTQKMSLVK